MFTEQLKGLHGPYNYFCQNETVLDPLFQRFWRPLSKRLPSNLAPNVITYTGLAINVVATLILLAHSPDAIKEVPTWMCVMVAVVVFVYQTLDAMDGKQCYLVGLKHQYLEEFADHACDAVSTVLLCTQLSIVMQLGAFPWFTLTFVIVGMTVFYCAHWQVYTSGVVKFGLFDVTEIQVSAIILILLPAIFGHTVWLIKVPYLEINLKKLVMIGKLAVMMYGCVKSILLIGTNVKDQGRSLAGTNPFSPGVPLLQALFLAIVVPMLSPKLLIDHPCLVALTLGLTLSKITTSLIISCLSRTPVSLTNSTFLGSCMQIINFLVGSPINDTYLIIVILMFVLVDLFRYHFLFAYESCWYLNTHYFRVPADSWRKRTNCFQKDGLTKTEQECQRRIGKDSNIPRNKRN